MRKIYLVTALAGFVALAACSGGKTEDKKDTSDNTGSVSSASSVNGEEIYKKTCLACHQANGEGIANTFPPLAKSDFLVNRDQVIEQVIKGKSGEMTVNGVKYNGTMPPQAISDEEIAAVLTYVYSSWGNSGGPVSVDEVKAVRNKAQ
ncbi:MAG: cytochrome c [Bacteroidota bacterium]